LISPPLRLTFILAAILGSLLLGAQSIAISAVGKAVLPSTDTSQPDGVETPTSEPLSDTNLTSTVPSNQCEGGGALRLLDVAWICDRSHQAVPMPESLRVLYVDNTNPNASDQNQGTAIRHPLKTLVHAAQIARPGDHLQVRAGGTYDDGPVELARSGTARHPIVLEAYPAEEWFSHSEPAEITGEGIISRGNSHILIRGLNLANISGHGIRIEGPGVTDITILGNRTHKTCGSGISVWGVPWRADPGDYENMSDVIVESNLLEFGTFGCRNEVITVANGVRRASVRFNTIRFSDHDDMGDEGIDFKEGVTDSEIYGNLCYDLGDKCIYIDGGTAKWNNVASPYHNPVVTDIDIHSNRVIGGPSAGIAIATEGKGRVDSIRIYNNIVSGTARSGIRVHEHTDDSGTIANISIIHNTVFNAKRNGIRLVRPDTTATIFGNIIWGSGDRSMIDVNQAPSVINICPESTCAIHSDPLLRVNDGSFVPEPGSPAIDSVSEGAVTRDFYGTKRPQGPRFDYGAVEVAAQDGVDRG